MRLRQTATATKAGPAEGREGGREGGRKEGRRAREGERRRARSGGAILPFPFSDKRSFMPPEPLLLRRCRSSERERAKEGERKDGETYVRTYSLTDCCLRPATRTALREGDEREDTHEHEVSPRSSSLAAAAAHVCGRTNERTNDRWNEEEQRHLDIVRALPAMNELKGRGQSVARARSASSRGVWLALIKQDR